ncbi:thioredoxin domain-containing protein 16-like isoform X3 [Scylla paramamosain]|uniref:thioredoxin domain-containing protein 16-like isoform X3 n=1 Tax=Scylla paramamosain TaxID=85552 RepID=UPI0030838AAF
MVLACQGKKSLSGEYCAGLIPVPDPWLEPLAEIVHEPAGCRHGSAHYPPRPQTDPAAEPAPCLHSLPDTPFLLAPPGPARGKMKLFVILSLQLLILTAQSQRILGNKNSLSSSVERDSNKAEGKEYSKNSHQNKIRDKRPTQDEVASTLTLTEVKEHDLPVQSSQTKISSEEILITHNPREHQSTEGNQYKNASPSSKGKMSHHDSAKPNEEWDHPKPRQGKEKRDAVWTLHEDGDFEAFTSRTSVVIVYFYRNSGSAALLRFLREYNKSAQELLQYKVLLATVECGEYQVPQYCTSDKINRFAYGFRGGQEKIAFPLDTLFNSNAIVASALHLALINTVPILQTAGERRNLEKRCRGHCDLIFAYLRTLGTLEHRTFLEVAHAHQSSFVFAITTYTAGTLGLPPSPHSEEEDQEKGVWVIHCQDKTVNQECVVSNYRGKMMLQQLLHFIHVLQLPLWHEVSEVPASEEFKTPYDQADLPWVLLLHDNSSAARVKILAPSLAQLLHGSVAIITVNLEGVSKELLATVGLNYHSITTPALAFIQRDQKSATTLLNDYDDALEWVKEQLFVMHQKEPQSKEEQGYLPVQVVEELQQDDEVVLGIMESSFPGVVQLAGPTPYNAILKNKKLAVIVFYLAWDPASNALLQHLSTVAPMLEEHNSQASLYSINCFDWPIVCDMQGISTYPVLRLYPYSRRNVTYRGPINYYHILKTILLVEQGTPVELANMRAVEDMLALKRDVHPASWFINAAVVGVFSEEKGASTFREVCHMLEGTELLGLHISQEAVNTYCTSEEGCVVVSKPGDLFQPWRTLEAPSLRSPAITSILSHATLDVMDQLDPERYSAVHVRTENMDEASFIQHLIIVFLPSHTFQSRPAMPQSIPGAPWSHSFRRNRKKPQNDFLTTISYLAAELSEPGFIFSWLTWDDPLAQQLGPMYGLFPELQTLVGLEVKEGAVHIFPQGNNTHASLKAWLIAVREGHSTPSVLLPKKMWEPRLPGFDYLRFMQQDQDHDAEDHLVLEMEADLTTKLHEGGAQAKGNKTSINKKVH